MTIIGKYFPMFPNKFAGNFTEITGEQYKFLWETPRRFKSLRGKETLYVTGIELQIPLHISLYTDSSELTVNKIVIINQTYYESVSSDYRIDVYHNGSDGTTRLNFIPVVFVLTFKNSIKVGSDRLTLPLQWDTYLERTDGVFNLKILGELK